MKCDVANGWCPDYEKGHPDGCVISWMDGESIKNCKHRKRMNRLEKAFEKDCCNNKLLFQWTKEKERSVGTK